MKQCGWRRSGACYWWRTMDAYRTCCADRSGYADLVYGAGDFRLPRRPAFATRFDRAGIRYCGYRHSLLAPVRSPQHPWHDATSRFMHSPVLFDELGHRFGAVAQMANEG